MNRQEFIEDIKTRSATEIISMPHVMAVVTDAMIDELEESRLIIAKALEGTTEPIHIENLKRTLLVMDTMLHGMRAQLDGIQQSTALIITPGAAVKPE
jgi:hypothetical protein